MGGDEREAMWVMYLCPDQLADFFRPPVFLSPSSFFTPADFFIRLEGRRPSVTKHCVPCRWGAGVGGGGDTLGWGSRGSKAA